MAGYIGSKAVTLSTTAADVTGNATINGDLTVKGTTVTIDSAAVQEIRLGDNDKMTFGDATGGDLQIYHDGSNSYIDDAGTGNLTIRANQINFDKYTGEAMARFRADGNTELFYDNASKLATTSTGIDVTGTVTADGLTVDGGTAYHKLISTFPATYTTNLQVGQQVNISNNAVTDTLSIENTGTAAATNIQFSTAGSEAMRIDSSGRLLLGTTTAGESSADDLTIATTGQTGITLRSGTANAGAIYFADGTSGTAQYSGYIYYGHSNNALGFATNATERMRIDSSGDVAIGGTSTAAWNGAQGRKFIVSGANNTIVSLQSSTTSANQGAILEGYATSVTSGSPALGSVAFLRTNTSNTALSSATAFYTNNAGSVDERMRITSSGGVAIGATDLTRHGQTTKTLIYNSSGTAAHAALHCSRNGTGTEFQVAFSNAYGVRGTITTTASAVAYNTTSDYRLKENVTDVTDGITRLKQLAPKRFNFIVNPDVTVDGFIAHEVQDVIPEAISGAKDAMRDEEYEVTPAVEATFDEEGNVLTEAVDAVMGTRSVPDYQGIDQSKLVPLLTAALQEAIAKIETLETEMTSVKARLDALEGN